MKRGPQCRLDKKLSIKNLLKVVWKSFDIPEASNVENRGLKQRITLKDCLKGAFAMFSLKSPSLLSFDLGSREKTIDYNLKSLYRLKRVPCDTYMRERLDVVDPKDLRQPFLNLFHVAQRAKLLQRYEFLGGYLLSVDGTGYFESKNIFCENCCKKTHRNGVVGYYHYMLGAAIVHPSLKQVFPLCPEPIVKQDGNSKNDCEARALYRMLPDIKREHPNIKKLILVCDALSANTPAINYIKSFDYSYIINAKPSATKNLYDWIAGLPLNEVKLTKGKNKYSFRYINKVPLNDNKEAPFVNFLECVAEEVKGRKVSKKTFAWVTDIKIGDKNVHDIMLGGRARWKIENETFNTLKNQGYQLEHNFGHGKKNLSSMFAMIMMLAFLVDQIQEAACGLFQTAMKCNYSRRRFWEKFRALFYGFLIDSWEDLFDSITFGPKGTKLVPNTS